MGSNRMIHEYLQILSSPAHLLVELTVEVATGFILYPVIRAIFNRWIKKHDEEVHSG